MERSQHIRTGRRFPMNLYNKIEEKLKNRSEDAQETEEETKAEKKEDTGLVKCPKCGRQVERARVVRKKYVCYECGGYFRIKTNNRIRMVADAKSFEPWFEDMDVSNPLDYEGYEDKLAAAREKTGLKEAVTVGRCKVFGDDIVLGVCDSRFMMASMGHVVGEKIT
ncbi:MAG: acetyl-CoA carboxylase carboxyl transferase subunit beta, partial [Lachnospiraceae bacterium]|nr:acetyl-CoA carboxylase carboxyl transferase subunit beta [Lachnospiraceae bacterium]